MLASTWHPYTLYTCIWKKDCGKQHTAAQLLPTSVRHSALKVEEKKGGKGEKGASSLLEKDEDIFKNKNSCSKNLNGLALLDVTSHFGHLNPPSSLQETPFQVTLLWSISSMSFFSIRAENFLVITHCKKQMLES